MAPDDPIPLRLGPADSEEPVRSGADLAMDRYAAGDDRAFSEVHRELAPRIGRYLLRMTGDPQRAADLTQETFLRVHRSRGTFSEGSPVVPWCFAIARNTLRSEGRRAARAAPTEPLGEEPEGELADGEHALRTKQAMGVVRAVLEGLPDAQREAFVLLRFEGLSVTEAALVVDATPTAVKLRAFRAYEAIREALGRSGR